MPLTFDLRLAVTQRDVNTVRRLVTSGADVNVAVRGATPLSLAVYRGYVDVAETLLSSGADPRLTSLDHLERKEPPLCSACRLGDTPMVDLLLRCPRVDVDQTDFFGKTPLWLAVKERRPDLVRKLLDHGADVSRGSRLWSESPLYLATRCRGRASIAEMLILAGCPADVVDLDGRTPLFWAMQNDEKRVFCGLVLSGTPLGLMLADSRLLTPGESLDRNVDCRLRPSGVSLGLAVAESRLLPSGESRLVPFGESLGLAFDECRLPAAWISDPGFCVWAEELWGRSLSLQCLTRNLVRRRLVQRWKQVDKKSLEALGLPKEIVEFVDMKDFRQLDLL